MLQLGFFASHNGSNMQAIIDACENRTLNAKPCVVISNNLDSQALVRAQRHGIPAFHMNLKNYASPEELDDAMLRVLREHGVEIVVLAGYMRKIGSRTLNGYRGRIINIHPALLPKHGGQGMYGIRVHQSVLQSGDVETGVTIHVVNSEYDEGEILAQCRVAVHPDDTAETLAARVLHREHEFLVETLQRIERKELSLPATS